MKHYLDLSVGDSIPYTPPRGIQHGPEIEAVWHALLVPPQKERAAQEFLRKRDVFAFFPTKEKTRTVRGKRTTFDHPEIAGHVYARFTQAPQWDVMKERMRLITGVFCLHGNPVPISRDVIRHLQGMTVDARKLREARAEMLKLAPGDHATLREGPFEGFEVEITATRNGRLMWKVLTGQMLGKPITGESKRTDLIKPGEPDDFGDELPL